MLQMPSAGYSPIGDPEQARKLLQQKALMDALGAPSPTPTARPLADTSTMPPVATKPIGQPVAAAPNVPASVSAPPEYTMPPVPMAPIGQPAQPAMPEPTRGDFQPKELHGWRKAVGVGLTGLGAFASPQIGQNIEDQLFSQPKREAETQFEQAHKTWEDSQTLPAKVRQENALASEQEAKAEAALHPVAKPISDEVASKTVDTGNGIYQWNPKSQRYDIRVADSKSKETATHYEQAQITDPKFPSGRTVNYDPSKGKFYDPDTGAEIPHAQKFTKPDAADPVSMSPEAVDMAAQVYVITGQPPPLGMGAAGMRQKILNRAGEFASGKAKPGSTAGDDVSKNKADFDVAKSPGNVAFFGSANSLLDKGGTLDQLTAQGQKIPQGQFPTLNSAKDWISLKEGKGPLSGFASTALGVADDYSKVMGGGTGSDSAREAALALIAKAQSPEMRAEAINGIRNAVRSQRNSRIGNNAMLKKMYGGSEESAAPASAKTLTMAQVQQAAKDHGVSVDEAKRQAVAQGYEVK